jgi:hypothetical protein
MDFPVELLRRAGVLVTERRNYRNEGSTNLALKMSDLLDRLIDVNVPQENKRAFVEKIAHQNALSPEEAAKKF